MKRLVFVLLLFFPFINAFAMVVDKNTIEVGINDVEDIKLYMDVKEEVREVSFSLVFSNNDIRAEFVPNDGYALQHTGGVSYKISFDKNVTGKVLLGVVRVTTNDNTGNGNISIYNGSSISNNGNVSLDNQIINVHVSDNKVIDKKNLISRIESKIVRIDLKKDIYNYDISISDDISELDLKPVSDDENVIFDISEQDVSKIKDNKIVIKAKLDDYEEEYVINVKIDNKKVEIDDSDFVPDNSYKKKWIFISIGLCIMFFISLVWVKMSNRV